MGQQEQEPNEKKHVNLMVSPIFSVPQKKFFACGATAQTSFYLVLNLLEMKPSRNETLFLDGVAIVSGGLFQKKEMKPSRNECIVYS